MDREAPEVQGNESEDSLIPPVRLTCGGYWMGEIPQVDIPQWYQGPYFYGVGLDLSLESYKEIRYKPPYSVPFDGELTLCD
jgi:hypothetical protein